VGDLRDENESLKDQRMELISRAREQVAVRNGLNQEFRSLITQVRDLRAKRDELNRKVKELKTQRDGYRARVTEERQRLEKLEAEVEDFSKRVSGSYSKIREEMKQIEWKIQTNPLTPQVERPLIKHLSGLESELAVHEKLKRMRDRVLECRATMTGLRIKAQEVHGELTALADESEKVHLELTKVAEQASLKKKEADEAHRSFVEAKTMLDSQQEKFIGNLVKIKEIRDQARVEFEGTRMHMEKERVRKEREVREKLASSGSEKMQKGRKISLDEFKALMEKGKI
jgi:uncharacterized coiled-coil DUF342 family protein